MPAGRPTDTSDIAAGVTCLRRGGVIACPTEAVWGLSCDPFREAAVLRLLALKQRDVDKGLILVAADVAQFEGLAAWELLPEARRKVVEATWPGPHTWILPATARVPRWITGAHAGVAMRVSGHPVVSALCAAFGRVLVSTSANPSGSPPARYRQALDARIVAALDAIVEGETGGLAQPTPIRDARSGVALRE